ncbi:MAG: hypothetical protein AABY10_00310, partial [Nanoarchaeota archaeon]
MSIDDKMEGVMMKALHNNLGYRPKEKVVIVAQRWASSLPQDTKRVLDGSVELCEGLSRVYSVAGVNVSL